MSATYDPALPTDKDHVRFLIGDTAVSVAKLSDEEIAAVISDQLVSGQALKYAAAADCLSSLVGRWASLGAGIKTKMLHQLSRTWGVDESSKTALEDRICWLRERAARISTRGVGSFFRSTTSIGSRNG